METEKRERILRAALEMFVNNGFEGSPTSRIAKNAGVATGTLFHYFQTKEELINMLYLDIKMRMLSGMKQNLDQADTIRQKVECLWYNSITWSLNNSNENKFFLMFSSSAYITNKTREEGLNQFRFIMDIFEEGIRQGCLKSVPLELLFETSVSIIQGSAKYFALSPDSFKNQEKRSECFEILWDAIKSK